MRHSSTVLAFDSTFVNKNKIASGAKSFVIRPVALDTVTLKVNSADKYLSPSPTTTQLLTKEHASLIESSIGKGATFSPPDVIISSLILPYKARSPVSGSKYPESPVW